MDHYAANKEGGQLLHATAWTEGTVTSGKMPVSEGHVLLRLHFHYVSEMTKPPTQRTDYWLPRVRDDGGGRDVCDRKNATSHSTVQPPWRTEEGENFVKQSTSHIILQFPLWRGEKKIL